MIQAIYNQKDTTIYEQYSVLNTGLDEIIELQKTFVGSSPYNSRILLKFDTSQIVAQLGGSIATGSATKYYLKLYTTEPYEIPVDYTLYAYPISGSWNMGSGRYSSMPTASDGATWNYRINSTNTGSAWLTASFNPGTTGEWATNPGGGNWYTAPAASQSFSYQTADVEMDVTNVVKAWVSGTLVNDGFIIKKSTTDESSSDLFTSLKFFGKDTHTIYQPKLEIRYDDSIYHTSYSLVDYSDEVNLNITNLQPSYAAESKARINIQARPKYPTRTFATSSNYLDKYQLASSSLYSIVDAHSSTVIIPFDDSYTKISADSNGNFFRLNTTSLPTERYYKLLITTKTSQGEEYIYDKNWIFKVAK
jgi:hypothetical protein